MVNEESAPGLSGRDERHVVSHFCYVSSNKLQWGAISSRLISVELVLFYQPPQGRVSFRAGSKGAKRCEQERETQQKRHQPEVVCWFYMGQCGLKPESFLWPRRWQSSNKNVLGSFCITGYVKSTDGAFGLCSTSVMTSLWDALRSWVMFTCGHWFFPFLM